MTLQTRVALYSAHAGTDIPCRLWEGMKKGSAAALPVPINLFTQVTGS
jgi:hypothetical protein